MKAVRNRRLVVSRATALFMSVVITLAASLGQFGCSSAVAEVNGMVLERGEFNSEVARRIAIIEESNPEELEGNRGKRLTEETERQVATEQIRAVLIDEEAKKAGVSVPDDEVTKRLEQEKARLGPDQFDAELRKQKLTEEEYTERLRQQLLVERLGEQLTADVTVTEGEAETYYVTNRDLFSRSTMVRVAHILLGTKGQAEMVLEQIRKGEDFADLARSVSKDVATRENGGEMGWIERGTMDPAFEQAAFALITGEVSEVVQAADGYHIIKVLERREAYTPPFEELKDQAVSALLSQKKEEVFTDLLRTVYANALVELDSGIGEWDPTTGMVVGSEGG